jgi:hypothetical protein
MPVQVYERAVRCSRLPQSSLKRRGFACLAYENHPNAKLGEKMYHPEADVLDRLPVVQSCSESVQSEISLGARLTDFADGDA